MNHRFHDALNVETRIWIRAQTVTYFKGETLRHALHKMFTWIHYLGERDYGAECISLSWTEGKEHDDGTLLFTYKLNDMVK